MIRFADLPLSGRGRTAALLAAAVLLLAGCVPDRETMQRRLREDNPRMQTATIAQVVRAGDRTLVPELINLLESEDEGVRFVAAAALHKLTGQNFGFHFATTAEERQQIIGRWRTWWEAQGESAAPEATGNPTSAQPDADSAKARST